MNLPQVYMCSPSWTLCPTHSCSFFSFPPIPCSKVGQILLLKAFYWCWSWNSKTLATWCKELTHLKRPWCWERLKATGEGDDRGGDDWMASPTRWTWVWVSSGSWWWTGKPGMLQSMGCKESDMTEWLNWTDGPESYMIWKLISDLSEVGN